MPRPRRSNLGRRTNNAVYYHRRQAVGRDNARVQPPPNSDLHYLESFYNYLDSITYKRCDNCKRLKLTACAAANCSAFFAQKITPNSLLRIAWRLALYLRNFKISQLPNKC